MNSVITAKALSQSHNLFGHEWFYDFRELQHFVKDDKILERMSRKYSGITKQWTPELNSEWICRLYLSAKMILGATLQLESLIYAKRHNLRIVAPYLEYYTFLSLLRAIVYTLPDADWDNGNLTVIGHKKTINLAFDYITRFNVDGAHQIKELTMDLKANRELISYKLPSSGDSNLKHHDNIVKLATLLAEVAQINSEILERSVLKNSDEKNFILLNDYVYHLLNIEIENRAFFDMEDAYRLDYLARKYPLPTNIMHGMTEGHVEDFFGAWFDEDSDECAFNPDSNWGLIFDVP
ncbi:MAG: hypothetical protein ABF508_08965 [Zymomonas mobilis]|uniref:hypothetical protein n=1 Tax=Zymomonas mobilis TaxID=542 RepID=UPI0039ECF2CA